MENYSFCLFRIPENGGRVLWEITNTCNYKCKYCIFSAQNKKVSGELSTSEVFNTLKSLKENNFTHIKITGGEPFVREDLIEILQKAAELGFSVDVSTNGSLVTKEKAEQIKKINLKMIHVSLDGHNKEIHELVRGKDTFEKTLRGIHNLVCNGIYVRIGTVIYKENENNLEEMVKFAVSLGVNEIIFSFMEAVGRMKNDIRLISQKSISIVKSEIEELSKVYQDKIKVSFSFTEKAKKCEDGICPGVKRFLYINNLGQISPCSWAVQENQEFISKKTLKDSSFEEIINSDPIQSYLSYIDQLRQEDYKGCPCKRR